MARPTLLSKEVQDSICETIRAAGTVEDAAVRVGVHESTVREWMARGKMEESGPYREFHDAVRKARIDRRLGLEALIRKQAPDHWQAAAWLLERTEPKRYAQRVRVHVEEQLTDAVARVTRALATEPDVLERVLAAIAQEDSDGGAGEDSGSEDRKDAGDGEAV